MGKQQGWAQPPSGLLPSGLLPSEGPSFVRALDLERWSKAEDKTSELIACIQPNQPSEIRRNAVAEYVKRLIMQCFPCQVFTFGSVPLKTYLPDGDIDLTAFSENPTVKENWAQQVKEILEIEEKNENAEFRVKEVQYIQAEVKIIKCLVENIVVDISFNQLGGLCTLCFLEEVDNLIAKDHLFKRSIILIKAWCYYESRILGAHHGLISTYALETLVLYIFNVYDKDFLGPLEVLYRFLEFFSKFDWENYCVSLRGPVRISSLPEVAVEPPRNDDKELLLNERFLEACTAVYGVPSSNQENQGTPFTSKHFNVIDPLRVNNNLGRSVSRGNFFRIRSAFAFGAKKLARLLDCPKEDLHYEVNGFFMNTWDRHGSGHRPDAPRSDLLRSRLSHRESLHGHENQQSSNSRRVEAYLDRDSRVEGNRGSHGSSTPHLDSRASNAASVSRVQGQKNYGNSSNSRTSDATLRRESNSKPGQGGNADKEQKFSRVENANNIQGRYVFARTHSSPELTDSYSEASSQGRRSRAPELAGKNQAASARLDNSRRKVIEPVSNEEYSFARQQIDAATAADSKSVSNSYHDDGARLSVVSEEFESVSGTQGMIHQEEIMNMAASSSQAQGFHKQIHLPLNFNSTHLPLSLVPMGYAQRNMAGMMPMMEPWGPNMAFPHGLVSSQALAHYFPGVNMAPNPEDSVDAAERNLVSSSVEGEHDLWQEHEQGSVRGSDLDNGNIDSTSSSRNYDPSSSRVVSSSSYRGHQRSRVAANREEQTDAFQYQGGRENDAYLDDRSPSSRSVRSTHSSPFRSKTSSESSWDGSTSKASKPARERRGRKGGSTVVQTVGYTKGQTVSEHSSAPADEDWNSVSTVGTEVIERNPGPQSVQMPGFEPVQGSASDSIMPFGPVLIGPGSRQRPGDPGVIFYPTGPPVPFVAMLPFYNFPSEGSGSEASTSQFGGEDGTDSLQNFDSSSSRLENLEELSASAAIAAPVESLELKPDILNSDFTSHWHNLQYGRHCQTTRFPAAPPMMYPSPNVLSPVYVPGGQLPWDSPRRPPSPNVNIFSHLVSNGPRLVPVAPVQPVSNGPASVYHVDEMPRFRGGTGTYLPNPKVSPRERQNRRGNYSYDRSDHHNERDGNWNIGVKSRASGRGHGRNQQPDKSRTEHNSMASEAQSNRQWSSSYRQGSSFQYHNQNNTMQQQMNLIEGGGSNNLAYGMYPVMNPSTSSVSSSSSNGPPVPPVFMFYPYDRSSHGYGPSSDQQLEMGPGDVPGVGVGMGGGEGLQQQIQGQGARLVVEELHRSSPDQPSSPKQRR